ncbi:hypothetical protein [Solirubrobacter soli]|uniref:hypothetical protein n=1 Tax=Solirubrobacter soli TaxID=363832 RepID=UPI000488EEA2|nr:hypothetical protein [Solirubrobacter soli]
MWGQGLARDNRFVAQIVEAMPEILGKTHSKLAFDASRSGAKIEASGEQRPDFADTFPKLFADAPARQAFLDSTSDQPATGLYGEIPGSFPTVRGQVRLMADALGETIHVALVDGGINDIPLEEIINPSIASGEFIERWDEVIRDAAHDKVLKLLTRVRDKCPNAVILYFGFFAPLSYGSHVSKIRAAFKHQFDDDFAWWMNDVFGFEDVNAAIRQAQARSMWMQGRWQYWTRRAVTEANLDPALRHHGLLYVPSGFGSPNSVFGDKPWLHEDYTAPTTDAGRAMRERHCPRLLQFGAMQALYKRSLATGPQGFPDTDDARDLRDAIDGPARLRAALAAYADDRGVDTLVRMRDALHEEILRIGRALIASMSHPNDAGADSYAKHAIHRLKRHLKVTPMITRDERPGATPPLPGTVTLGTELARYKMRGEGSLHAFVGHHFVDSLAVRVVTREDSDEAFSADMWLLVAVKASNGTLERRDYLLNFPYGRTAVPSTFLGPARAIVRKLYPQFEPGAKDTFTIDTMGRLRLEEIQSCRIVASDDPFADGPDIADRGRVWRPQSVTLEVNGVKVLTRDVSGKEFTFNDSLDLAYPDPHADGLPPRLKPVKFEQVEPLQGARGANGAVAHDASE